MRCQNCGRRLPCAPCHARELERRELAEVFEVPDGTPFIVWFAGSPDQQVQNLNRLRAEWPYALEEIEPTEPGDMWGACIARRQCSIGKAVGAEFEVSDTRIVKLSKHWVESLMEKDCALKPTS